jgi:hypothetical protein
MNGFMTKGLSMEARLRNGSAAMVAMILVGGCSTLGSGWGLASKPNESPPETVSIIADVEPVAEKSETLAAVAEFLERTKTYDASAQKGAVDSADPGSRASQESQPVVPADRSGPMRRSPVEPSSASSHLVSVLSNTHMSIESLPRDAPPTMVTPVVKSVTVHAAAGTERAVQSGDGQSLSNQGLDAAPFESAQTLAGWLDELQQRVDSGDDFDAEWQLRLAHLALNHDARATAVSPTLRQPGGQILSSLLDAAVATRRAIRAPHAFADGSLLAAERFRAAVSTQANPQIAAVALCSKVVTFGVYDELNLETFVPGRPLHAIVYTEVANLQPETTAEGQYRTALGSRVELLTTDGHSVWQQEEPEIVDLCRRRRTDFFVAQRVTFPPSLRGGEYVLKVSVEDKTSGRVDEAAHPVILGGRTSVAQLP